MKASVSSLAALLIAIVILYSLSTASEETIFKNYPKNEEVQETWIVQNKSGQGPGCYPVAPTSKLMIRVNNGKNSTVSVLIDSQLNLTWANVGSSTIVKPPFTIENKLDFNLLNLTELVAKNYIQNNQTNVIVSFSNSHTVFGKTNCWLNQEHMSNGSHQIYTSKHAYESMRFFAMRLNYSSIFKLANNPEVSHIWLDRKFQANLDQSVPIIKDPTDWAKIEMSYGRRINGSGVKIAILDTGIDPTHPDFYFPNGTSKIAQTISFTGESANDKFGHGTHCASIAAGTGAASSGQYTGVAPQATIYNVKVLNNQGEGLESWIISGIQWAVDNGANVLSMSFGAQTPSDGTDPLSTTVNWATEQGAVCVVAAGNSGPAMHTITTPGISKLAITVGASSKSDAIATFSSRGPTNDNRIKPDVLAPGVNIIAARASGTNMGTPISQYYTVASGTSMATPHVAGAVALLLDANPSLTPIQVKKALSNYAKDLGLNVLEQGSGRIDVCRAVNASLIGESSISFGRVNLSTSYTRIIAFQNLANNTVTVSLNVETWHIPDKTSYTVTSLNTSSFTLSYGATKNAELSLNPNEMLPSGYFEGRITATFNSVNIRIPFLFCVMSQLNVEITDENDSKLMAAFILIDAQNGKTKAYASERISAQFLIPEGDYVIQAMNVYTWIPTGSFDAHTSFIVHENFSVGKSETICLQLSLSQAYKLNVRSTDEKGKPVHLLSKLLLTPYYTMAYFSEIGTFTSQYLYLTNISTYMSAPCYFGYVGLSQDDIHWSEYGSLTSEVDAYFIGWDLSNFGVSTFPDTLTYTNSELATFNIENLLSKLSPISTIWFNQIAGMWQSGLWLGFQTNPGITWRAHILPYHFKRDLEASWSELEWSCIYVMSTYPYESAEYYVIDRHFNPIVKGETSTYFMGKTPLLPQTVQETVPYYGNGLYIPYYPLLIQENLFIAKTDSKAEKRVEALKNGILIYNETVSWAQEPINISHFMESNGYGLYSFIVKTETSLNYSSQNIAKYVINYNGSNTDLIPPSITEIDCKSCFTTSEYQLKIQLTDNDRIAYVSLLYSMDNDTWTYKPLTHLGGNNYSANLTISYWVQKISIAVEATDRSNNSIQFITKPIATRGYETQIYAEVNSDKISGRLTVTGGSLIQPVYLKVKSNEKVMYTPTDIEGNFAFTISQLTTFPLEIVMESLGVYKKSSKLVFSIFDLNEDGKVNMQDVEICSLAFGATPEDKRWNSNYDFDKDEWITVLDFQLIVDNQDE